MTHYKIIYNPTSNKGKAAELLPTVRQELDRFHLDYDLVLTEHPGHALELTYQAVLDGFDVVVAAGGDGTANEVINGLMTVKRSGNGTAAIAVLPIGRGNDFNYSMGGAADWRESVRLLAEGTKHWIDIGIVKGGLFPDGRYFGNGVGIGFDAVVGFIAARQRITGFLGYFVAAIRTMYAYSPAPVMEIELESETITQPSLMVTIMNGRRLGGGFMIAPKGDPGDGLLDLCIAHEVSKPKIFNLISKFLQGTQYEDAAIQGRQASKVSVKAVKGLLPVHADGETIAVECSQIEIELLPAQLEMFLAEG